MPESHVAVPAVASADVPVGLRWRLVAIGNEPSCVPSEASGSRIRPGKPRRRSRRPPERVVPRPETNANFAFVRESESMCRRRADRTGAGEEMERARIGNRRQLRLCNDFTDDRSRGFAQRESGSDRQRTAVLGETGDSYDRRLRVGVVERDDHLSR